MKDISGQSLSHSVRFHEYKATANEMIKAMEYGMNTFLCDDLDRVSYDLSEEECKEVNWTGEFRKKDRLYLKTNVRLEKPVILQFLKMRKYKTLVVFGHEWAFLQDKKRLEIIIRKLYQNDIEFI